MLVVKSGNIWDQSADAYCVTTNGILKNDGRLVMGKGIALDAKRKFPDIDLRLGTLVKQFGNIPFFLNDIKIISFPTKNHWKNSSSLDLIQSSAKLIKIIADNDNLKTIVLPKPGCSNGQLSWFSVKPVLDEIFDDRFIVVDLN